MGCITEKIANSSSEEAEVEVRRLLRTTDVCLVSDWELHPPPEPPGIMLLFSIGAATRLPDLLDKTAGNNQQENQQLSQKVAPPRSCRGGGDNSSSISSIDPGLFAVCELRVCGRSPCVHLYFCTSSGPCGHTLKIAAASEITDSSSSQKTEKLFQAALPWHQISKFLSGVGHIFLKRFNSAKQKETDCPAFMS